MSSPADSDLVSAPKPFSECTEDELAALLRAIRFAHPDYGLRRLHREITETLPDRLAAAASERSEPEPAEDVGDIRRFREVKLKTVKSLMKKIGMGPAQVLPAGTDEGASDAAPQRAPSLEVGEAPRLKLYTVGMHGRPASEDPVLPPASASAGDGDISLGRVLLDVPGVLDAASAPHQAVISMDSDRPTGTPAAPSRSERRRAELVERRRRAREAKKTGFREGGAPSMDKACAAGSRHPPASSTDREGIVVKVQVAAGPSNDLSPMLLYDQSRSVRTFVHPSTSDCYEQLKHAAVLRGIRGTAGREGGIKCYFKGRLMPNGGGSDGDRRVLEVDWGTVVSGMEW